MTDAQANAVLGQLEDEEIGADNLTQCLESINKQLTKGFGLEIASMVVNGVKIHAVINQHADAVAKESFGQRVDVHDRAFTRLVLEELCEGPSARSTLINLRSELQEPLKMDLDRAERNVEMMLEEHWLSYDEGTTANRRDSMAAKLKLGPRAFLELAHLLTDFGFPKEDLPQFIFYR